ncbi:MAG: proton-conducting transporter membrane subunit [Gammaproteobacteria bacterium]
MSPIYLIAAGLGGAFTLGLLRDQWRAAGYAVTLGVLAFTSWIAASWVITLASGSASTVEIITAGTQPPFAVNLRLGLAEAALVLLMNLTGLLSALYLKDTLFKQGRRAMAVLLIFSMALSGIVMTRDLFNLFVFFELTVISTGGLILLSRDERALGAGFKYLVASQVVSILMLVGIIFVYHASGSLNIDSMAGVSGLLVKGGALAFFLVFIAVVAELKVFPANGWALDIYESAHPAFSALVSAATGTATLFAVDKLLLIGGGPWMQVASAIGIVSFVGANLFALAQQNDRRLLGYSSVAQIGLVLTVVGQKEILGDDYLLVAGGVLLAHAVAKAGLYWLSGLIVSRDLTAWSALRTNPLMLFAFVTFVALLIGLPPFPGFYAKWELVHAMAGEGRLLLLGLLLFGALIEAGYLFRWFGYVIKRDVVDTVPARSVVKRIAVFSAVVAGWGLGYLWGELSPHSNLLLAPPILFALLFLPLEWLPGRLKNGLAIAGLLAWFWLSYPEYDPLQLIFGAIILVGGALILLASFQTPGRRLGFYPSAMLMYAGLAMLIVAEDAFSFFAAWESLTIGSYFLTTWSSRWVAPS